MLTWNLNFSIGLLLFICSVSYVFGKELRSVSTLDSKHKVMAMNKIISQTPQMKPQHFGVQNAVSFPVNATYAIVEYYDSSTCGKGFTNGASYLLDTCLAGNETSVIYTCDSNGLSIQDYTDTVCGTADGTPGLIPNQCYSYGDASLQTIACGTSDPLAFSQNSFVGVNYQNAGCADDVVYALAWKNGYCLSFSNPDDDAIESSILFDYPYQKFYDSSNKCKGTAAFSFNVEALGCQGNDDVVEPTDAYTYTKYVEVGTSSAAVSRFAFIGFTGCVALLMSFSSLLKN